MIFFIYILIFYAENSKIDYIAVKMDKNKNNRSYIFKNEK